MSASYPFGSLPLCNCEGCKLYRKKLEHARIGLLSVLLERGWDLFTDHRWDDKEPGTIALMKLLGLPPPDSPVWKGHWW